MWAKQFKQIAPPDKKDIGYSAHKLKTNIFNPESNGKN